MTLDILGIGLALPPPRNVRDLVRESGGDPTLHEGWEHACIADSDDHPSTFASAALGAALADAEITAQQLDLVLAVGVSRDYVPSWAMATEVMRLHRASPTCIGFDLTIGCLGSLVGLNNALGWLQTMGGGYAAIVTAERWSHTIDRKRPESRPLWGHADGGGALVVSLGRPGRSRATFHGAAFATNHDYNGLVLVKYGGTRHPIAPPGETPFTRTVAAVPPKEVWASYSNAYRNAFVALRERFGVVPTRLVCNQISPNIVRMIADAAGVEEARTCWTGHELGHVGGADVMIGLRRILDAGPLDGPLAMGASVPHAVGAGLITPGTVSTSST